MFVIHSRLNLLLISVSSFSLFLSPLPPLQRRYEITFDQIYVSRPTHTEGDGQQGHLYPQEARLRNLTYSSPIFVDVMTKVLVPDRNSHDEETGDAVHWVPENEDLEDSTPEKPDKVYIGRVSFFKMMSIELFSLE